MKNYFTSDLHLGHANVIKYCDRPFASVEEMDETLIANWNAKVHKDDAVYILGDLVWQSCDPIPYLARLKGKKHLIVGNHDRWVAMPEAAGYFESVTSYAELVLNCRNFTLCHYPMLEWKNSRKIGSSRLGYMVHGHIHNGVKPLYRPLFELPNALNAGVDINGFAPVSFDELVANNEAFKREALLRMNALDETP